MTSSDPGICVFIPAYNAEQTLPSLIRRIGDWEIICRLFVIDDGSIDDTASSISRVAKENNKIKIISFPNNRGYGAAVKKGLQLSRSVNPDFCVCLHADGQYPPEYIGLFIRYMIENSVDILQGSRHKSGTALEGNMPLYKFFFGKILVSLENMVFGLRMTDYHSGYLCYSREALRSIPFDRLSSSFDFDLEVIASARARRLKIDELAVPTHYGEEKSYLHAITYGLRVLRVLLRYGLGTYRRG